MTKEKMMFALEGAVDEHLRGLFNNFCLNMSSQSIERAAEEFTNGIAQLIRAEDRASKIIDAALSE